MLFDKERWEKIRLKGGAVVRPLSNPFEAVWFEAKRLESPKKDAAPGPGVTEEATKAIELAVREKERRRHWFMSTEHLLLGVLQAATGPLADAFSQLGLVNKVIERVLEFREPERPKKVKASDLLKDEDLLRRYSEEASPLLQEFRDVLSMTAELARSHGRPISPGLYFLAICQSENSRAAEALRRAGYDLQQLAQRVMFLL